MELNSTALTATGNTRLVNEDSYYLNGNYKEQACSNEESHENRTADYGIYAVCDGMGGEHNGYIASYLCARLLEDFQGRDISDFLPYFERANHLVCDYIREHDNLKSGSTAALICISGSKAVVYNIGDSRVYLCRNKELCQLSVDHTSAQRMVNMGCLTSEQAKKDRSRHTLTQHIGIFEEEFVIEPYKSEPFSIQPGDRFLLCSDGLSDSVDTHILNEILSDNTRSTKTACRRLVDYALANGSKDNITALVVDVR